MIGCCAEHILNEAAAAVAEAGVSLGNSLEAEYDRQLAFKTKALAEFAQGRWLEPGVIAFQDGSRLCFDGLDIDVFPPPLAAVWPASACVGLFPTPSAKELS